LPARALCRFPIRNPFDLPISRQARSDFGSHLYCRFRQFARISICTNHLQSRFGWLSNCTTVFIPRRTQESRALVGSSGGERIGQPAAWLGIPADGLPAYCSSKFAVEKNPWPPPPKQISPISTAVPLRNLILTSNNFYFSRFSCESMLGTVSSEPITGSSSPTSIPALASAPAPPDRSPVTRSSSACRSGLRSHSPELTANRALTQGMLHRPVRRFLFKVCVPQ
jgi:hypothetical protein